MCTLLISKLEGVRIFSTLSLFCQELHRPKITPLFLKKVKENRLRFLKEQNYNNYKWGIFSAIQEVLPFKCCVTL